MSFFFLYNRNIVNIYAIIIVVVVVSLLFPSRAQAVVAVYNTRVRYTNRRAAAGVNDWEMERLLRRNYIA